MADDLRRTLQEATPKPSREVDVESTWLRGRGAAMRRLTFLAAASLIVLLAGGWALADRWNDSAADIAPSRKDGDNEQVDANKNLPPAQRVLLASFTSASGDATVRDQRVDLVDLTTDTTGELSVTNFNFGDADFKLERIGSVFVYRGSTGTETATFSIDINDRPSPMNLGRSWYFVPAADDQHAWLALLDPESPTTVRALEGVELVDAQTGSVADIPNHRPPDSWIAGAVDEGLVFGKDGQLLVWDPRTDEVVLRFNATFPVATAADHIAWTEEHGPRAGELHLTDPSTGADLVAQPPGGSFFTDVAYSGAFSPDGESLALPLRWNGAMRVAIVDADTGLTTVVPGSRLHESYRLITWSASGEWLFFTDGTELVSYSPTERYSVTHELDPTRTYFAIASE